LEGVDAVVHLAGANLADGRWTDARRALIRSSRVDGTRLLAEALAGLERRPRVLVMASAIGFYGDRGDALLDEDSAPGTGFLAEVVREWEEAAAPAEAAGIRTVKLRLGVVLSRDGGALPKLLTPFKLGVGGRVGDGGQWMSWVALDDVVRAFAHALVDDGLSGVANLVAPNPVTNRALTEALARVLRRPAFVPVPRWAIRGAFGDMGRETILASTRVAPKRLDERGFTFAHPEIEAALRHILGRPA
ncbi:MAG: TIGR01777 family protein, partial [Deltaproteobacteria bacterium]